MAYLVEFLWVPLGPVMNKSEVRLDSSELRKVVKSFISRVKKLTKFDFHVEKMRNVEWRNHQKILCVPEGDASVIVRSAVY